MKTNRRKFISASLAGGITTIIGPKTFGRPTDPVLTREEIRSRYEKLDEIIRKPVLKKELFTS
ncbi:MAG: hypothetical protein HPY62_01905, partial [Bacteroidales bacterium]|nr:hypothetical protein [Bacteroidales bacterium]